MTMRHAIAGGILAIIGVLFPAPAGAVRVVPLKYDVQLASGQTKKGFVDITNTEPAKMKFDFSVQAFKQVNGNGDLQFFDDEKIKAGIMLDYASYELEPHQTLRLVFLVDGTKLASGDSYAAIFASTGPAGGAAAQSARAGTLLLVQNGSAGDHRAEITGITVSPLQIGSAITGLYTVKNTADSKKSTGFSPRVDISVDPIHKNSVQPSTLVFAGIERSNPFTIQTERFGFYKVTAAFGESKKRSLGVFCDPVRVIYVLHDRIVCRCNMADEAMATVGWRISAPQGKTPSATT